MLLDKDLTLSAAQAVLGTDVASTNVIDFKINDGLDRRGLRIRASIHTAFAGGTSINFIVQESVDEAFTSPVQIAQSGAVALASLTKGAIPLDIPFPPTTRRFVRLFYDVTGTMSAGTIDAFVTGDTPVANNQADSATSF